MLKWYKEFPTKPGFYWFYGHRFKGETEKELCIVKVSKISNGVMHTCNGNFMFEKETGEGWFFPLLIPDIPKYVK